MSGGEPSCPTPRDDLSERIVLAHGEGGRMMRRLIRERIVPALLGDGLLGEGLLGEGDAAVLPLVHEPLAMTTDSYVVSPLFFPGGDIGRLAVYGTVNDLAVAGATPRWMSLALIVEEGLEYSVLDRVLASIATAGRRANVAVVTGDTKVVPRGAADRLFINTTGIGTLNASPPAGPRSLQVGDELIVSGPIGRHGIAVLAAREGLGFEPAPESDCGPLVESAAALLRCGGTVRAMRDATRGGVAAVCHEWAEACGQTVWLNEAAVPVTAETRGVCELLGLDPLHVANEGTMVVAVRAGESALALAALRSVPESAQAVCIGRVEARTAAAVVVRRASGRAIPLDDPPGAPLPRIC